MVRRQRNLSPWNRALRPPELVIHNSRLHESRNNRERKRIQFITYTSKSSCYEFHGQSEWRVAILQEVPGQETRSRPSLLDVSHMRAEDGSPLPLAGDLRGTTKLQSFSSFPYIHDVVLLPLLRSLGDLGIQGDIE